MDNFIFGAVTDCDGHNCNGVVVLEISYNWDQGFYTKHSKSPKPKCLWNFPH